MLLLYLNLPKLCYNAASKMLNLLITIIHSAPNCCHFYFVPLRAAREEETMMEPIATARHCHFLWGAELEYLNCESLF